MADSLEFQVKDDNLLKVSKKIFDSQKGPIISLGYDVQNQIQNAFAVVPLAFNDSLPLGIVLPQKLLSTISSKLDNSLEKNGLMQANLVIHPNRGLEIPTSLLISLSLKPEYFKEYNDSVDAMHTLDYLGILALEEGLKLKQRPFWISTNYNFSKITDEAQLNNPHIHNPYFEKFLDQMVKQSFN